MKAVYVLKRIVAYAIDLMLVVTPISFGLPLLSMNLLVYIPERMRPFAGLGSWGFSIFLTALVLGVCTGLTGRTPGKLVTFLKVQDHNGDPPGIAAGILREIVKDVSLGFLFGMIWALQGIVSGRRAFYDEWLDLDVEDLHPFGLTPTQRNFRKYMRKAARR
jgi:uncharacterized RDD family membrane protein YckC